MRMNLEVGGGCHCRGPVSIAV